MITALSRTTYIVQVKRDEPMKKLCCVNRALRGADDYTVSYKWYIFTLGNLVSNTWLKPTVSECL